MSGGLGRGHGGSFGRGNTPDVYKFTGDDTPAPLQDRIAASRSRSAFNPMARTFIPKLNSKDQDSDMQQALEESKKTAEEEEKRRMKKPSAAKETGASAAGYKTRSGQNAKAGYVSDDDDTGGDFVQPRKDKDRFHTSNKASKYPVHNETINDQLADSRTQDAFAVGNNQRGGSDKRNVAALDTVVKMSYSQAATPKLSSMPKNTKPDIDETDSKTGVCNKMEQMQINDSKNVPGISMSAEELIRSCGLSPDDSSSEDSSDGTCSGVTTKEKNPGTRFNPFTGSWEQKPNPKLLEPVPVYPLDITLFKQVHWPHPQDPQFQFDERDRKRTLSETVQAYTAWLDEHDRILTEQLKNEKVPNSATPVYVTYHEGEILGTKGLDFTDGSEACKWFDRCFGGKPTKDADEALKSEESTKSAKEAEKGGSRKFLGKNTK